MFVIRGPTTICHLPVPILANILSEHWQCSKELALLCKAFAAATKCKQFWWPVIRSKLLSGITNPAERKWIEDVVDPFARMPKQMPLLPRLKWNAFLGWLSPGRSCLYNKAYEQEHLRIRFYTHSPKYVLEFIRITSSTWNMELYSLGAMVGSGLEHRAPLYVLQQDGLCYVQIDDDIRWMRGARRTSEGKRWNGGCTEHPQGLTELIGTGWWE